MSSPTGVCCSRALKRTIIMNEISALIGDPVEFYARQIQRLHKLGIDASNLPISQLAHRSKSFRDYESVRNALEKHARANVENVWNGRPISKVLLNTPVQLSPTAQVDLIELIPPFHQSVYPMGLEHIGFVVGDDLEEFGQKHRRVLTGRQFQSDVCDPYIVRFEDYTHAKFYRLSLMDVCLRENQRFDGIMRAPFTPEDLDAGPYPELN